MLVNSENTHFIALNRGIWVRFDLAVWAVVRTLTVAALCAVVCVVFIAPRFSISEGLRGAMSQNVNEAFHLSSTQS